MDPSHSEDPFAAAGYRLRGLGLRSTPQRRAILAAFRGGPAEHLSADEVYARAEYAVPGLGRGTVYATLAEFTEMGLLAAFGTPEPVRYEINTSPHLHFRCRLCLRIYDVAGPDPDRSAFERDGHCVERLDLRGEGICGACADYDLGLRAGVAAITSSGASQNLSADAAGVIEVSSPMGTLLVAATATGIARVGFSEHGDASFLRGLISPAGAEITNHLDRAREQLSGYFRGELSELGSAIDWRVIDGLSEPVQAAMRVPYAGHRSYHLLDSDETPHDVGYAFGANPIAIFGPCHRVTRGAQLCEAWVGGLDRRDWLLEHERSTSEGPAHLR